MEINMKYDAIVIGAGPAGLTAAIYLRRGEKSVLVIEKSTPGGQITHSPRVENYPGLATLSGNELGDKMFEHLMEQGGEVELDEVVAIRGVGGDYTVVGTDGEYHARSVIIATGSRHRTLGIEGEERLTGCGISYCAVCDGAFFRDMSVAVIGGGNSALQDAVMLSESCKKVYLVQNLAFLTGEERLQKLISQRDNVEIIYNSVVDKILGTDTLHGIEITDTVSGERRNLAVEGMFVCIGQKPENEPFKNLVRLDERGYIISDESCVPGAVCSDEGCPSREKCAKKGIFVAGDCRTKSVRQVTTATADGAVAALAACRFVDEL
jgi:thioredoxin reductase (NADPH)